MKTTNETISREGMIKEIEDYIGTFKSDDGNMFFNPIFIGDILNYIDKNCFRIKDENEYGLIEIDVKERERNVIWLYNHFMGRHNKSIDEQTDECITFVYNLISK